MSAVTRTVILAVALGLAVGPARADEHPVGGRLLRLRAPASAEQRLIDFRTSPDPTLARRAAGDPRQGAVLEVAGDGAGDGITGAIVLDAARWRGLGRPAGSKGFRYLDPSAASGVRRIVLRTGKRRGSLRVRGGGTAWPYEIGHPQGAITVRLRLGDQLYCAHFTRYRKNGAGRVVARRAPPPDDCGDGAPPLGCGNGTLDGVEECDDGGTTSLDGCSAACQLEDPRAVCAGVPAVAGTAIAAEPVVSGLSGFVHLTAPRLDPSRLYLVQRNGRIRIVRNGLLLPDPFLDLGSRVSTDGEGGLLSLAFHPAFETNRRFFVYYTRAAGDGGEIVIARFDATTPDAADPSSERILLVIPHPHFMNHYGGQVAFGLDGYLYAAPGDGGSGGDPDGNGQNLGTLLGKLLRLDVDVDTAPFHAIPPTNPFVAPDGARDEIWAFGLRNPFRFSFDRETGDLYVADVGQNTTEEVNVQPAASPGGENYGWKVREGDQCYAPPTGCPTDGFTSPVLTYGHDQSAQCSGSITGGFVYRGCALPDLRGTYFYADYCQRFVHTFRGVAGGVAQEEGDVTAALGSPGQLVTFGEDARGELYFGGLDGDVWKIVPRP
jgi:cysteine-rich repeat protein